jgi:WD40 repeat protein
LGAPQNRGLIQIWNPVTGALTETLNIDRSGRINDLAFSANGRYLAVAGSNNGSAIRILDWKAKQALFPSEYPSGPIAHLAYSPDGRQIAIATARRDGEVSLWDATTGKQSLTLHGNGDAGLAYSPDGWELGGVSAIGNYHLWTAEKGDCLIERALRDSDHVRERPRCAAISPLVDELASGVDDGQIHIRAIATGIERRVFRTYADDAVGAVAWSPDGKLLATARIGSRSMPSPPDAPAPSREAIQLWDTETGQLRKQLFSTIITDAEHYRRNNGFFQLAFSPDGELAAGAFSSGPIVVWNVAGGRQICELACKTVSPFCFSADGQMLIYADGYTIQVVELAAGQVCLPRQLPAPVGTSGLSTQARMSFRGGDISAIAVAPDGERFATALNRDHTVLIWTLAPDVGRSSRSDAPVNEAQLQQLWSRLAAIDGKAEYVAMFQLAATGDAAVKFIHDRFSPVQADPQQTRRISQLIAELDNDVPAVREKATDDLTTLGVAAEPLLRQALTKNPTLEQRTRIEGLLVPLDDPIQHHGGKLLQRIRAVRVLERIATPEAIKLLEELATGLPAARETHEAKRALEHCKSLANER